MEKFNEIINAINMINDHNYKKSDGVVKEFIRFIFTSIDEINEGAFEFIYEYAIKDSLMNLYEFAKENNLKEIMDSSLALPFFGYMQEGSKLKIGLKIDSEKNDSFVIDIDSSNNDIHIYCLNKKYYLIDDDISSYDCPKLYVYKFENKNKVEVSSPTIVCDCLFNDEGLMIRKEIEISYQDVVFSEISKKQTFIKYLIEKGNLKAAKDLILSYKEKFNLLPVLYDDKFRIIFERNKESFTIVNKISQCLIDNNIVYEESKEIYLNPENRLYDLNYFNNNCSKDGNYLIGIGKEENEKLKETYLRRLRSLD